MLTLPRCKSNAGHRLDRGFTLVELIMVIVVLGILSAFALPKFTDLSSDAKIANLKGLAGTIKTAASITRSQLKFEQLPLTGKYVATLDNETVYINDGYPGADAPGGIRKAANINATRSGESGFPSGDYYAVVLGIVAGGNGDGGMRFMFLDNPDTNCSVTYWNAEPGAPYIVDVVTSGC